MPPYRCGACGTRPRKHIGDIMKTSWMTTWRHLRPVLAGAAMALTLAACGGGGGDAGAPAVTPPSADPTLADGDSTDLRKIIVAVPPPATASSPGTTITTLRVHYH